MPDLNDIDRETVEEAVRIYLEEAYGDREPPPRVRERLAWPEGKTLADLAAGDAFERTPREAPPDACTHLRLRLGNPRYPHMKLGLDRVPETGDWVLTVDSHDEMLTEAAAPVERDAVDAIIRANAHIKTRIERRWTDAGLPTFEQYIRRRLADREGGA
ncbi:MAG: hypothetical protein R6X20_06540 [Phycisphaerae bacterium]